MHDTLKKIKKVVFSTDYDADGISCSVVGVTVLKAMGKDIVHILLNNEVPRGVSDVVIDKTLSKTKEDESFIFLTADHGSSDMERYVRLKKERPNVVIIMTDHHLIQDEKYLEETVDYIINPQYSKSDMNKAYSGCNVLYKLLEPFTDDAMKSELLPIVTFANLVDQMDMSNEENRKTYRDAISHMENHHVFQTLLKATFKKKMHDRWLLMNVGPLINSSHRLGRPDIAYHFFMGNTNYINLLKAFNKDRKEQTALLYDMLQKQVKANKHVLKNVMLLVNPTDNASFNGLVAGRIGNDINLPTFVLTRSNDVLKGSARAIQKIPLMDILDYINSKSNCLVHYAGHHAACGVAIKNDVDSIKEFVKYFDEYIEMNKIFYVKSEGGIGLDPRKIRDKVNDIEKGRPYGQGNPYPVFKSKFTVSSVKGFKFISKIYTEETDAEMIHFKPFNKKRGDTFVSQYTIEIDDRISLTANDIK